MESSQGVGVFFCEKTNRESACLSVAFEFSRFDATRRGGEEMLNYSSDKSQGAKRRGNGEWGGSACRVTPDLGCGKWDKEIA